MRLMIKLDQAEYEALRDSAQRDLRGAREQIRYIIRSTLLNAETKKPVTVETLASETVTGFEKGTT